MSALPTLIEADAAEINNQINLEKGVFSATELLERKTTEIPCLVEPIFPQVGLTALAGSSDTGKSSLLRQLAIAVVTGESTFLNFKLNQRYNKAIYVSTEDDDFAMSYLLNKNNRYKALPVEKYEGLTFIFDTFDLLQQLQQLLEKEKTDLIIIDAFTDLYGKSMNDTNQVRTFLNEYHQLAQRNKCLIIFLHHTGKRTEELAPSKHNLLGSQGFEAKMRLVVELRNDLLEAELKHFCIVKGNYLPKEMKTESYVLRFNDDLTFTPTGERRLFDLLKQSNNDSKVEKVKELLEQGKTQQQIAEMLSISQAQVSRIKKSIV